MSVFERAFQKIWNLQSRRQPPLLDDKVESLRRRMELVASMILQVPVSVRFTRQECGFVGNTLALPEPRRNVILQQTDVFLHLTLLACESKRKGLISAASGPMESRLEFEAVRSDLEHSLAIQWPGFQALKEKVLAWTYQYLESPEIDLYTRPQLPMTETLGFEAKTGQRDRQLTAQTERKHAGAKKIEYVNLNNQYSNPVQHSFEKTETADEYKGGRKMDSGGDELDLHAEALDEVNLSKVTRDGESARSVLNCDGSAFEMIAEEALPMEAGQIEFLYPEWNERKRRYLKDHCHLFQSIEMERNSPDLFSQPLIAKYRSQLEKWRGQLASLVFEPLWTHRLREGTEIDLDSAVRFYTDLAHRTSPSSNLYSQKLNRERDLEIHLLMDLSQSADSWIEGRRVLDVTLDSVGLLGLLMTELLPLVTVAGTWSATRHDCRFHILKGPRDPWLRFFKRATEVTAQGYTRLGPGIRHSTRLLSRSSARQKVLILFSDGKPTDLDGYEGVRGVSDIRQACLEAEATDIRTIAFIIGGENQAQAARMFTHRLHLRHPAELPEQAFQMLAHL